MNSKHTLLAGVFVTIALSCFAELSPDFLWVQKAGDGWQQQALCVGVDGLGNAYAVGAFLGEISLGNTNLIGNSNNEIFITKFDPAGDCLWAHQAGGSESDVGFGIAVQTNGTFYVTGYFRGTATFGSMTLNGGSLSDNAFVAKYDSAGSCLWARSANSGGSRAMATGADTAGNVYITGYFDGSAAFGTNSLSSPGTGNAMFLVKYDPAGTALWARQSSGGGNIQGQGLAVDSSGNVCVVGRFSSNPQFGTTTLSCTGSADAFVAKYDSAGNCLWARKTGGSDFDEAHAAAPTSGDGFLVTGYFRGAAAFGSTNLTGGGAFLAAYDSIGTLLWTSRIGNGSDDAGWSVAPDAAGNIYVAGGFSSWTFGSTNLDTAGGFVEKLSPAGASSWRQRAGNNSAKSLCIDLLGNAFVAGGFWGTSPFGTTSLTSSGDLDVFIGRLKPEIALQISASNGNALLSWPEFPPNFQLQTAQGRSGVWDNVPAALITSNAGQWSASFPVTNSGPQFFRLTRP